MESSAKTGPDSSVKWKSILRYILAMREMSLLLIILVFVVVMSITSVHFPTWANIRVLLTSVSVDGLVVIGMTIVLISGGIDLSVGSVLAFGMTICARLYKDGMSPWLAAPIALALCAAIGLLIGFVVTKSKLSHFIVTLCFMGIVRGFVFAITSGIPISLISEMPAHESFRFLGQGQIGGVFPMTVLIFLVAVVAAEFITRNSAAMRKVFYTGSNDQAARYSGINVNRVRVIACMIPSVLAGFAGILYMTRFSGAQLSAGGGLEMIAIASTVIGGASLTGGRGTVLGSVLGLTLMALVQNAMTLFIVPPFWQDMIRYMIVLAAVLLDKAQQNRRLRLQS